MFYFQVSRVIGLVLYSCRGSRGTFNPTPKLILQINRSLRQSESNKSESINPFNINKYVNLNTF